MLPEHMRKEQHNLRQPPHSDTTNQHSTAHYLVEKTKAQSVNGSKLGCAERRREGDRVLCGVEGGVAHSHTHTHNSTCLSTPRGRHSTAASHCTAWLSLVHASVHHSTVCVASHHHTTLPLYCTVHPWASMVTPSTTAPHTTGTLCVMGVGMCCDSEWINDRTMRSLLLRWTNIRYTPLCALPRMHACHPTSTCAISTCTDEHTYTQVPGPSG